MRIFLDANVMFSAAKSDGAVRALLGHLLERGHRCLADDFVVAEARRNLHTKGPQALPALDALLARIELSAYVQSPLTVPALAWLPEKDRPVLAAAMRLRCDVLVTGDRTHFGAGCGKAFGSVTIHSPRSLAESLLA